MKVPVARSRIEYGDFQTPLELAEQVCRRLVALGVSPEVVIEPTCGTGAFIKAAAQAFPQAGRIIGVEINSSYLDELRQCSEDFSRFESIELRQGDFFTTDWKALIGETKGRALVLGNLPWVTNSVQGAIGGINLPGKKNFQGLKGLDALMGKSNFDISEWMLIRLAEFLAGQGGELAVLCKASVARRLLGHLHLNHFPVSRAALFRIDAARHFGVSVEACLLYCRFGKAPREFDYEVYADLETANAVRTGWRNKVMVRDLTAFDENVELFGKSDCRWRSGVKHDCADVMELKVINGSLVNGLGAAVEIENTFLYPLLKGSDIANGRTLSTDRYLLLPQKNPGDDTRGIREFAPKTWSYLEAHADHLDFRKSRIYRDSPRFSVFGVGSYTFAPWKVAICGLYKRLDFRLVGPIGGRTVVFDDTVCFLSFETENEAREVLDFLHSEKTQTFLNAMIFWDEKRPIKSAILNNLKLPLARTASESLFAL
jgi:hypothetical protein